MSKYWDKEFTSVSVNTLWPKITIPLPKYQEQGDYKLPEDMGKAACKILKTDPFLRPDDFGQNGPRIDHLAF